MGTVAAYIDGFNLYYGMKSKYGRKYLWLDLAKLVRQLRPDDELVRVRYFTTIVRGEPEAAANQIHYLDALQAHTGDLLDIHIGWFRRKSLSPCRICGEHWLCGCPRRPRSFEEKETDVALAVAMVEDTANGLADLTLLISADSDFAPAVAAIKRMRPGHPVILGMPAGNMQPHKRFVDVGHFNINETALRHSQLPEEVAGPLGKTSWRRPEKWS